MSERREKSRRLVYSKQVPVEAFANFALVPEQTIEEPHPFFEQILSAVRQSDFEYKLFELSEELIEKREVR